MKKIHFTGIAGVGMAPLALMMKDLGWTVTGSDQNVFEPMLSFLNKSIDWQEGYDAKRVEDADIVVIGGSPLMNDINNPEFMRAKELGKKLVSYPYLIQEYLAKENSVVVAGSYGKTTTSAILMWLLDYIGVNPAFFSGGQPLNFNSGVRYTDSKYSVAEGDEYVAAWGFDMEPKFMYYKPSHTIITSTRWDHLNIYPTLESYIDAFRKLIKLTKENGGIVLLSASGENNDVLFNENPDIEYSYSLKDKTQLFKAKTHYSGVVDDVQNNIEFTTFKVYKNDVLLGNFQTTMIGNHNVEDCTAAIAMIDILGLDLKLAGEGLKLFKGIKRRQEVRGKTATGAIVMDDLAHSAVKAKATLEALRTRYKTEKIIAIFDPHASSLADRKTLEWYPGTFDLATEVIIPRVKVKKSTPKDQRVYGIDIVEAIKQTQPNVSYMATDEIIVDHLQEQDNKTLIVFMSSGGWRGMIEKLVVK